MVLFLLKEEVERVVKIEKMVVEMVTVVEPTLTMLTVVHGIALKVKNQSPELTEISCVITYVSVVIVMDTLVVFVRKQMR